VEHLVAKVGLVGLVMLGATWAARRWGDGVGGWIAGLPLTSGPMSLFLAVEQGPAFAARAAQSTMLALNGVAAFCVVYAALCGRSWIAAVTGGVCAFAVVCWALAGVVSTVGATLAITLPVLAFASRALRTVPAPIAREEGPGSDLPCRVVAAILLTMGVTQMAATLGPEVSGSISRLPIVAGVLATSALLRQGAEAARRVLRGVVVGSFGFVAFFVVVAVVLPRAGLPASYLSAVVAALVIQAAVPLATLGRA